VPLDAFEETRFRYLLTPEAQADDLEYQQMKNGIQPLFPYVVLDNKNKARD
jgi:hypothetical protein